MLLLWSQKIKREVAENKATFMVTDVQDTGESRGTACDGWEEREQLQGWGKRKSVRGGWG